MDNLYFVFKRKEYMPINFEDNVYLALHLYISYDKISIVTGLT